MARRNAAPPDSRTDDASGSACLPKVVFGLLFLLLSGLGGVEVMNVLRHPSLMPRKSPDGSRTLIFFQRGPAGAREAWIFDEPAGTSGPPRVVQFVDCRPEETRIGTIGWTSDMAAVYATAKPPAKMVLWLFEMEKGRLFVTDPDFALPGTTAIAESPAALAARWKRHGGAGPVAAEWYELGAMGEHLFFWQATRWTRLLP